VALLRRIAERPGLNRAWQLARGETMAATTGVQAGSKSFSVSGEIRKKLIKETFEDNTGLGPNARTLKLRWPVEPGHLVDDPLFGNNGSATFEARRRQRRSERT
jgi:hypothetical protein